MSERELKYVDNAPLREAVLASGRSFSEICREAGMVRPASPSRQKKGHKEHVDTSGLQRKLGLKPMTKDGKTYVKARIRYEEAVKICRAIGAYPVEVGV